MGSYRFFYSQVNSDVRPYRVKTIPYYDDLCFIYGDRTSGKKGNHSILDTTKF